MTTIYLTQPDSYLEADSRDFALIEQDRIQSRHAICETEQVIIFEGGILSRNALRAIRRYNIPLGFIGDNGRLSAQITPKETLLYATLQQKRHRDSDFCLALIHSFLRGRGYNTLQVLRSRGNQGVTERIEELLDILPALNHLSSLQAWHRQVTNLYYEALDSLRASVQPFESTVELAYALLSRELYGLLRSSGCAAEFGTLHRHCQNHLPLPCDLMEQFRPLIEAWIVEKNITSSQPTAFVARWQLLMNSPIFHPYAGQISWREALRWQVNEYVQAITETLEYRPFLLK